MNALHIKNTVLAVCDKCLLKGFLTIRQEFTPPFKITHKYFATRNNLCTFAAI